MNNPSTGVNQRELYRANPTTVQNMRTLQNRLHQICCQHINQLVRIETIDGQVYVGRLIQCDRGYVVIGMPRQADAYARYPYYNYNNELIQTLVLYELLVITLLYT